MTSIYQAIFNVQQAIPTVSKETTNPFHKSKYADLPTIWDAIRDVLKNEGLVVINQIEHDAGHDFINTRIIHVESGEEINSRCEVKLEKQTAQQYGSFITYIRRYHLSAMLGIVTDQDDDGNAASTAKPKMPAVKLDSEWFKKAQDEIQQIATLNFLQDWWTNNAAQIAALPGREKQILTAFKDAKKEELMPKKEADNG